MTALPSLPAQGFGLKLEPDLVGVGFRIADPALVLRELGSFSAPGLPERAVDKRRAEFLAGRLAAAHALSRLGAVTVVERNADGTPQFPPNIAGSITHGAERALCVVAPHGVVRSLGIDAERLLGEASSTELHRRICDPTETSALGTRVQLSEQRLVTLIFSAKESLFKCLWPFVGKFMDFSAARVIAGDGRGSSGCLHGTLELELSKEWSAEFQVGVRVACRWFMSEAHVETLVVLRPSPHRAL